jgi:hypothetical protein
MVGQVFTDAGYEEIGKFFSEFGKWITVLGSSIIALIPIVELLGKTFKKTGDEAAASGAKSLMAFGWVALVAAAIISVLIILTEALKMADEASAETSLEKTAKAADEATKAAEKMV